MAGRSKGNTDHFNQKAGKHLKILKVLKDLEGPITYSEILERLDVCNSTHIRNAVKELSDKGYVLRWPVKHPNENFTRPVYGYLYNPTPNDAIERYIAEEI